MYFYLLSARSGCVLVTAVFLVSSSGNICGRKGKREERREGGRKGGREKGRKGREGKGLKLKVASYFSFKD
jgi:hypothetical protein